MIVAGVSTWCDADLLRECLETLQSAGIPAVVLDGAYKTYAPRGPWHTPAKPLKEAVAGLAVQVHRGPELGWPDEATKKSQIVRRVRESEAFRKHRAEWILILDADERVETKGEALRDYVAQLDPEVLWGRVNIYRPDIERGGGNCHVPRLIRAVDGLEFRPPRDYDLYVKGKRIAYLDGEAVPPGMEKRHVTVPPSVLRIRHDHALRPPERLEMSARYVNERRRLHGVG